METQENRCFPIPPQHGQIGTVKLAGPKVRDVDFALAKLPERLSTRSVRLARMILIRPSATP